MDRVWRFYYAVSVKSERCMFHAKTYGTGKHRLTFREEIGQLLDKKFYILVLALPVLGVCVFNILPIVFMILIAFTNYGGDIVPPTALNYFAGLGLALLLDKDCVKGKAFWRAG